MFLEHWNRQKILCDIWQRFSYLLDERIEKKCKIFFFRGGFFFKSTLSILRCIWTGRINLKIFLGYNINYLSIWPFMCHPWFPTRKASKLTFVCFQLQLFSPIEHNAGAVCMKNVVECYKHFFGYFNALETHSVVGSLLFCGAQGPSRKSPSILVCIFYSLLALSPLSTAALQVHTRQSIECKPKVIHPKYY